MDDLTVWIRVLGTAAMVLSVAAAAIASISLAIVARWLTGSPEIKNGRRIAAWAAWWRSFSVLMVAILLGGAASVAVWSGETCELGSMTTGELFRVGTMTLVGGLLVGGALADVWERWALSHEAEKSNVGL